MQKSNVKVMIKLTSQAGTQFVGVRNYTNAQGEVSNQLIVSGYSYENAKAADLLALQQTNSAKLSAIVGYPVALVEEAMAKIEKSLTNPDQVRSEAQTNAYTWLTNGVKLHDESGDLHLTGLRVNKKVLQKGTYKEVKSKDITLCQNAIKKALDFKTTKIVQFKIKKGDYAIRGQVL